MITVHGYFDTCERIHRRAMYWIMCNICVHGSTHVYERKKEKKTIYRITNNHKDGYRDGKQLVNGKIKNHE